MLQFPKESDLYCHLTEFFNRRLEPKKGHSLLVRLLAIITNGSSPNANIHHHGSKDASSVWLRTLCAWNTYLTTTLPKKIKNTCWSHAQDIMSIAWTFSSKLNHSCYETRITTNSLQGNMYKISVSPLVGSSALSLKRRATSRKLEKTVGISKFIMKHFYEYTFIFRKHNFQCVLSEIWNIKPRNWTNLEFRIVFYHP